MTENLKLYIDELNKQYKTGIAREKTQEDSPRVFPGLSLKDVVDL
jgi:hypothetical protein